MSLTEISVRVAIVTVLALAALIAIGWRRSAQDYSRHTHRKGAASSATSSDEIAPTARLKSAEVAGRVAFRKILDIVGLGSIATFIGIIIALVVSTALAWMVTALLNRL